MVLVADERDPRPTPPVATTSPSVPIPTSPRPMGRLGPFFAAIWLAFLLDPLREGAHLLPGPRGAAAVGATVLFGAVYLALWFELRDRRGRLAPAPGGRVALAWTIALVALAAAMVATLGQDGMASVVYLAASVVMLYPVRVALAMVLSLTAAALVTGLTVPGWEHSPSLAFATLATAVAVFGVQSMMTRNVELVRAQETLAELAAERERTRLARDLHDILGHSLTVITIKAELAGRMFDDAPDRARAEIADLERLSRDALADVRRAVEGYRDLSLPGEIARARVALEAAGIEARLPGSTDEVPTDLRELFAWTVREGVTNVIRHSGAGRCEIVLRPDRVEVRDDGGRADSQARAEAGSGLTGLSERAAAVGARLSTRRLEPGWAIAVGVE